MNVIRHLIDLHLLVCHQEENQNKDRIPGTIVYIEFHIDQHTLTILSLVEPC